MSQASPFVETFVRTGPGAAYPSPDTVRPVSGDADLSRAIQAYRFFYPTVSGAAIFRENEDVGRVANRTFGPLDTRPRHIIFTASSDNPYAPVFLDLAAGPVVVELPPGPLLAGAIDVEQRWVADMGLSGPDGSRGGQHLFLPPDFTGLIPEGPHVWEATAHRLIVGVRSLPVRGDLRGAIERIRAITVRPLNQVTGWADPGWIDLTEARRDRVPLAWETRLKFWEVLQAVIDTEPAQLGPPDPYGALAVLGIRPGQPFAPHARLRGILEEAAWKGHLQMRAPRLVDRRPGRVAWPE